MEMRDSSRQVLQRIYEILENKKDGLSIEDLKNLLNMKRSTLIYYIRVLESNGFITSERIKEGKTGRPTIIKAIPKVIEKAISNFELDIIKDEKTQKVLREISNNEEITTKEIVNILGNTAGLIMGWLEEFGYIKNNMRLTKKGKGVLAS